MTETNDRGYGYTSENSPMLHAQRRVWRWWLWLSREHAFSRVKRHPWCCYHCSGVSLLCILVLFLWHWTKASFYFCNRLHSPFRGISWIHDTQLTFHQVTKNIHFITVFQFKKHIGSVLLNKHFIWQCPWCISLFPTQLGLRCFLLLSSSCPFLLLKSRGRFRKTFPFSPSFDTYFVLLSASSWSLEDIFLQLCIS